MVLLESSTVSHVVCGPVAIAGGENNTAASANIIANYGTTDLITPAAHAAAWGVCP
jgi:hypothetical protein